MKLKSKVIIPEKYSKYIKNTDFFAEYDTEVTDNKSILNIPVTATMLTLAWVTGSDLHVNVLDKTFKENMELLQDLFKGMYPRLPWKTKITADKLEENQINITDSERKTGLLFSGGIDSTFSLIKNLDLNPRLIMIWGSDNFAYPERSTHWNKAVQVYRDQANPLGLELNVIKTNVSEILDNKRIEHDFHTILNYGDIRQDLSHSLLLLPLAAPISINRFNDLLIAATGDSTFDFDAEPYACRPEADEKIIWADLKVKQDGKVFRDDKIREIAKYLKHDELTIRVCTRTSEKAAKELGLLNDCSCEKCYRTILNLIQEGIDPNICGFKVEKTTFENMRNFLESDYDPYKNYYWKKIKSEIPEKIEFDIHGSKTFFEYLSRFEFPEERKHGLGREIYYKTPYKISKFILYYVFNPLKIKIY